MPEVEVQDGAAPQTDSSRWSGRLAVVIPVFGRQDLTHQLLDDIRHDQLAPDIFVVDNGGDFTPSHEEVVLRPPRNLGWLGGTNAGVLAAAPGNYAAYVLLNNDTRLSPGFFRGLVEAWVETDAAVVAPAYDGVWPHQRTVPAGRAADHRPENRHHEVPFADGTCLFVPHDTLIRVGLLDESGFGRTGWGAEIDYALRVRLAGGKIFVTDLSYLTHATGSTASQAFPDYEALGRADLARGLDAKWGPSWRKLSPILEAVHHRGRKRRAVDLLGSLTTLRRVTPPRWLPPT